MPYYLHYKTIISSSHRLPKYDGKCSKEHGHNWKIHVTCKVDKEQELEYGMVIDFNKIKNIISEFDHTSLNNFMENPTVENLAKTLYYLIPHCTGIKIEETPGHYVIYTEVNYG
jgi:6-pyruvoyltetrahydropterin/6-carboxytetrahydropterin synthase